MTADTVSDRAELRARIARVQAEYRQVMEDCISAGGAEPAKFIDKGIPQSQLFMVELIPFIHRYYFSQPTNVTKSVLEIGPQSFGGTQLLHSIHNQNTYTKLRLDITALDITRSFEMLRELIVPDVEFLVQDLNTITDRVWDFVICSHVVEHVPEPVEFLKKCQSVARDFVLVACPWAENPLIPGHKNTIDKRFVQAVGGDDLLIYTNYSWGKNREVCIFRLPGRGR